MKVSKVHGKTELLLLILNFDVYRSFDRNFQKENERNEKNSVNS